MIFVFSLENEISFQAVYSHYAKMAQYRDTKEIPLILVGTQGELPALVVMGTFVVIKLERLLAIF